MKGFFRFFFMFLYFHNIMSGIIVKTKETKPPNTKLELAQRKDDEMRNPCVKVLLLAVIFVIFWAIIESLRMYVHL